MNTNDLIPVDWQNRRVLTTNQLAKEYGTDSKHISQNFSHSKEHFKEGVHYFKLEGEALRRFKRRFEKFELAVSPFASCLYLWTEEGCLRHCKMLNTDKALDIFNELKRDYFQTAETPVVTQAEHNAKARGSLGYIDDNNVAWLEAEHVARGLGFTTIATSGNECVRWARVNDYLREFGYEEQVGKGDYLPENMVYRLAMKANNDRAVDFQIKIANEIMPSIRKYGFYISPSARETADEIFDAHNRLLSSTKSEPGNPQIADKLIEVARLMEPSPERNKILLHAANLIAGKNFF